MIKKLCITISVVATVVFISLFFQSYTKIQKLEQSIELQNITIEEMNKVSKEINERSKNKDDRIKIVESKIKSLEKKNTLLEKENEKLKKRDKELNAKIKKSNQKRKTPYDDSKEVRVSVEKDATPKKEAKSTDDVQSTKDENNSEGYPIEVTAYTAFCAEGCTGITATGIDVSSSSWYNGYKVIATDPNFMAMGETGTIVFQNGSSIPVIAMDTGGAINGSIIDMLVDSHEEAIQFGRQSATLIKKDG